MDEPVAREELLAGYARPYRRWLPAAWRFDGVPQILATALVLDAAAALAEAALIDGAPRLLVAVAVDEAGELVTWRFAPLGALDAPPPGTVLLPGIPCHAASEAGRVPFEPADAGRAAEQLAEAQDAAARREAAAARDAGERLRAQEERLALASEARSTAAALRRHTGQ